MPEPIDTARVTADLIAPVSGPIVWASEVGSTNDLIALRARAGAPEGLVIGADSQTAGRGRRGRAWVAAPGDAVLFSVLLRPSRSGHDVGVLPITAAVGVAAGLASLGIPIGVVWPNDLWVGGRKLGGILCELASSGQRLAWAVVGVGINVRRSPVLEGGRWQPTSVAEVAGAALTRDDVLAAVLRGLGDWFGRWYRDGDEPVIEAFARRDVLAGRAVRVAVPTGTLTGVADGVNANGALRIATPDGAIVTVSSGEVTGVDAAGVHDTP